MLNAQPAVRRRGVARRPALEPVAAPDHPLAHRHLDPQRAARRAVPRERRVRRPLAHVLRDALELRRGLREPVRQDQAREIDVFLARERRVYPALVHLVHVARDVRAKVPAPALRGEVERLLGVLREAGHEELQERVDVDGEVRERVHLGVVGRVGVSGADGLVEEDHVRDVRPGVRVRDRRVRGRNRAGAVLEEEAGRRAAAWPAVEPHHERG